MTTRNIVITGIEPATLSLRHPLGINLDLLVRMVNQSGVGIDPTLAQFVMLPRSLGGVYPYDMVAQDVVNGVASVSVPGTMLTDTLGYNLEIYSRKANDVAGDPPLPTGLLARGALITEGSAYTSSGPMNMINIPVVGGPPGPPGEAGTRGSIWTTGQGAPTSTEGALPGDMYLDQLTGDVWSFEDGTWVVRSH
jgi:hypothetical protein